MSIIDLDEFFRQNCVDRMEGKSCEECKHHVLEVSCERLMELPTAEVTLCHLDSPCEYQNADIAMPSAQPEHTCVNCGRTVNNGGWYADGRTRCPIEEHYALPKDGYCHLWEKRNVTDDDYPERREK